MMPGWEVGDELEEKRLPPVTRLQLIKYAGASGDYNPIHTVDEDARRAGLPGVIAHGMLTAATMSLLFSPYLEYGYVRGLRVRFLAPVFLGDELTVGARVTGIEDTGEGRVYGFEAYVKKEKAVASGAVEFLAFAGHE